MIHLSVQVAIRNQKGSTFNATISGLSKTDTKLTKDWKFNWKELYDQEAQLFKLVYKGRIQGVMKLEEENEAYYVLKNIEVSPSNYGSNGEYTNVAEILISFACLKSFELNTGHYKGFLVFTSKRNLIKYYQQKYGAELIFRERMIINPQKGRYLIKEHLKIDLDHE